MSEDPSNPLAATRISEKHLVQAGQAQPADAEPIREPVKVGDLVAGKYRIQRVLGSSGMGIVYLANHEAIGQQVAIKFLLAAARNEDGMKRFNREARAMAKVHSEHVVRIFDVGELDATTPYIVMDYLQGRDLQSFMAEMRRVPVAFTCDVLLQVCEALAAAHAAGVIHRDLKPPNIFLADCSDGTARVKVIDFGVAKLREDTEKADNVTSTSTLVGSPRYMSPEQINGVGKALDHRADVWALGVIMQEMLTGRRLYNVDGVGPLLVAIATRAPLDIAQLDPTLPPAIVDLVRRTLVKDPAQRVPDVAVFADGLAPFVPDGALRAARVRSTLEGKRSDLKNSVGKSSWSAMSSPPGFGEPTPSGTAFPTGASGGHPYASFGAGPIIALPPVPLGNKKIALIAGCLGVTAGLGVLLIALSLGHSARANGSATRTGAAATSISTSESSSTSETAPPTANATSGNSAAAHAGEAEPQARGPIVGVPSEDAGASTEPARTRAGSGARPRAATTANAASPAATTTTVAPTPVAPPRAAATASSRFD